MYILQIYIICIDLYEFSYNNSTEFIYITPYFTAVDKLTAITHRRTTVNPFVSETMVQKACMV